MNENTRIFLNSSAIKHCFFWFVIFTMHIITANWTFYLTAREVLESSIIMTSLQIVVAYTTLGILIPKFLNEGKKLSFILTFILTLVFVVTIYHFVKVYYTEVTYPETYFNYFKSYGHSTVFERLLNIPVLVSKAVFYTSPTVLLLLFKFYRDQQRLSKLNEQKRTAELSALKHQLNPHFLFNTLNNLYSLALEKSDKTPEVIEKLSEILDYMLYGCNDKFVPLKKEIDLIENYLALEKIRYGKRANIIFTKEINEVVKIAPLILLTFIENAFKHGVVQELNEAKISIDIQIINQEIVFSIENTIPKNVNSKVDKHCIGIDNIKKQLSLLYGDQYSLNIEANQTKYKLSLKLEIK